MEQTKAPRCLIDFMVRSGGRDDELITPIKVIAMMSIKNLKLPPLAKRLEKKYKEKRLMIAKPPVVVASLPWNWI
jgi:hypothetical protein